MDWDKLKRIIVKNTQLPTIITQHEGLNIIRDDVIFGGTKMRAILQLMKQFKKDGYSQFAYVGPVTGFAIIAISLGAFALDCESYFWSKDYNLPKKPLQQILIEELPGAHLEMVSAADAKIAQLACDFVYNSGDKAKLLSIGNMTKEYPNALRETIRNNDVYLAKSNAEVSMVRKNPSKLSKLRKLKWKFCELPVRKLFMVATGASVYYIMESIFPKIPISVIQVSSKIWNKYPIDYKRTTIYKAPQRFSRDTDILPPWDSVATYDAKSYQFITDEDKKMKGVFVYNIAADKSIQDILALMKQYRK